MQSNILTRTIALSQNGICINVIQVRNFPKIYPWRYNRQNRESYLDPTRTPYTDKYNVNEFNRHRERKEWQKVVFKESDNRFNRYKWHEAYTSDPKEAKATAKSRLDRLTMSIKDRGHAREQVGYTPLDGIQERILSIYRQMQLSDSNASQETDSDILNTNLNQNRALKFNLIIACMEAFNHELPTSHLTDMQYIKDLVEYYSTPVNGVNPYETLIAQTKSLPENLCLLPEPLRYNKEDDDFFGQTALPGNVSRVEGLRAAKKYPILNQDEFHWPDI